MGRGIFQWSQTKCIFFNALIKREMLSHILYQQLWQKTHNISADESPGSKVNGISVVFELEEKALGF